MSTIKVSIEDGGNGLLQQISLVSHFAGLEALSKAGNAIKDEQRKAMKSMKSHWIKEFVNGKLNIRFDKGYSAELGKRISHATGDTENPDSMSNFITSYLMDKSNTVVIGGMHKRFRPMMIKDGEFRGYESSVGATSKKTHAILLKMDSGKKNKYYKDGVTEDPRVRGFMAKGYRSASSKVKDIMLNQHEKIVGRKINTTKIKVEKRVS